VRRFFKFRVVLRLINGTFYGLGANIKSRNPKTSVKVFASFFKFTIYKHHHIILNAG